MPHIKQKAIVVGAATAIAVSFVFATASSVNRRENLNRQLAEQRRADNQLCREIKVIDDILVVQLQAAQRRVLVSIPDSNNRVRKEQLRVLQEGIDQLRAHRCWAPKED